MAEHRETDTLPRFSLRQLFALVYVVALVLAVCRVWDIGVFLAMILAAIWIGNVLVKRRFHVRHEDSSDGVREGNASAMVTRKSTVLRVLWAAVIGAIGVAIWAFCASVDISDSRFFRDLWYAAPIRHGTLFHELLFRVSSVGVLVLIVFAIPAAVMGYKLIAVGKVLRTTVLEQRRTFVLAGFVPPAVCLILLVALSVKYGSPGNGLTWLSVSGLTMWALLLAAHFRWKLSMVIGIVPVALLAHLLFPFLQNLADDPVIRREFDAHRIVDVRGGRVGVWFEPGLVLSKPGKNSAVIVDLLGKVDPAWRWDLDPNDAIPPAQVEDQLVTSLDLKRLLEIIPSQNCRRVIVKRIATSDDVFRSFHAVELLVLNKHGYRDGQTPESWWKSREELFRVDLDLSRLELLRRVSVKLDSEYVRMELPIRELWTDQHEALLWTLNARLHQLLNLPKLIRNLTREQMTLSDEYGRIGIPARFDWTAHVNEQLAAAAVDTERGRRWGFIDVHGDFVVPPKYVDARPFREGFAAVQMEDKKWGFINQVGDIVIDAQFDSIGAFCRGICSVTIAAHKGYIDRNGRVVIPLIYETTSGFKLREPLAIVGIDGKEGYMNTAGEVVIPCRFDSAYLFEGQHAMVRFGTAARHDRWFINRHGKIVKYIGPPTY
jgi:hypothetical protein